MAKTNIIAGLDIGSGKMTCIAAAHDFDTNTLKVLAGRSVPCRGLRGGMVSDIRETSAAVTHVLGSIERECNQEISSLFVGVRGSHLESFSNHGTYNISRMDKEITQSDMALAIENAKAMPIKNDNEIVNVITQGYSIDKQKGITNPEGMEGSLLEVDVHITTGSSTHLNNLAKAIQRPGYKIDGTFYGLVPLGDCVLTQEEKEKLCAVARRVRPDFVKTSTGFGTGGATLDDVRLMKHCVGDGIRVKAAGGIRTVDDALAFLKAGADRLGTSAGVEIVEGYRALLARENEEQA